MMKKSIVTLALLSILTFAMATSTCFADTKSRRGTTPPPTADSSSSSYVSEPYSSGSGNPSFALGVSTGDLGGVLGNQAVTAILGLKNGDMLDLRAAITGTSPVFTFGIGGLYKHTISQHGSAGFHVGGGLALGQEAIGVNGHFGVTIAGVGGFHFDMPGLSAIKVHVDAGPAITIINSTTNFQIGGFSPILGLSILYEF